MFAPPFRDPFNYNFDPLVPIELDLVGAAMHSRFAAEGKPGVTMRKGSSYSTWWNGGLRTTAYFHNMIGLLTETIGNPTPIEIPFVPDEQLPRRLPYPIEPQDVALPAVDRLLGDRQLRGARPRVAQQGELPLQHLPDGEELDRARQPRHWTTTPRRVIAAQTRSAAARRPRAVRPAATSPMPRRRTRRRGARSRTSRSCCAIPACAIRAATSFRPISRTFRPRPSSSTRCSRPASTVHRATAPFTVGGKSYPAGSYVVKTAQAFRPHVLDMFEPQDHPDDIPYPGGPPTPPVRQRRLDARVSDGREVRSHPRRLRRPVRDS